MTNEPVDRIYGTPLSVWVTQIPAELPFDAVGLWQIVPGAIDRFGLERTSLEDFVRRAIHALLDAGAVPVVAGVGTQYEWIRRGDLGANRDQITENVIAEWHKLGNDVDKLVGSIWFARPRPGTNYVKM